MGMFSEINAAGNAEFLEGIILKALNDPKYGDVRSAVKEFVKEELVERYYCECGDSYGMHKAHPDILKEFPSK